MPDSHFCAARVKEKHGLERAGAMLRETCADLFISKQKVRQAEAIELVRSKRQSSCQNLGFASRPFVLCGLPIKRPRPGELLHERRNGHFLLQVTGHPSYGLPWGQDRLVPIFLATLAVRQQRQRITLRSGAEMLDAFGLQQGGTQYRHLVGAFQRIFGATIFFGTDTQRAKAAVIHQARFNFMSEARIWYAQDPGQVSARLGTTRVAGNAQPAVFNRQIAMYLAKHVGGWSTTAIGRFYNGRDHSTVCYALKRVEALRENDPEVDGLLAALASEIRTVGAERVSRTERPTRTAAGCKDLLYSDAFLDALADRLSIRMLSRAPGIHGSESKDDAPALNGKESRGR